jgi:hypothetical protein
MQALRGSHGVKMGTCTSGRPILAPLVAGSAPCTRPVMGRSPVISE